MRERFTIITDDDLHASLVRVSSIGSPKPATATPVADAGGSSSVDTSPSAGAAATSFNLGACFKMGEGK